LSDQFDELLAKEKMDRISSVSVDILRALVILHGSAWQSDLVDTLSGLWRLKGLGMNDMIDLVHSIPEALKKVEELGLVESEQRPRGDLSSVETVEDKLYSTKGLWPINSILSSDPLIKKYIREVMNYRPSEP
jgi:hypothetical protein